MTTTTTRPWESWIYGTGVTLLAAQAAAGSIRHAHDAAVQLGQGTPGWLPWTMAGTPDLLAVLAGLELRRRHRGEADVRLPLGILLASVAVLVASQLITAQATVGGWIAAAWPAAAFLAVVALLETTPDKRKPRPAARRPAAPAPAADPGPGTVSTPPTVAPLADATRDDVRAAVVAAHLADQPNGRPNYDVLMAELAVSRRTAERLVKQARDAAA